MDKNDMREGVKIHAVQKRPSPVNEVGYHVIHGENITELQARVVSYMSEGWSVVGGVAGTDHGDGDGFRDLYQAMVRY